MNKEFWGWGKRNRSRILDILLADFRGKHNDGSVLSVEHSCLFLKQRLVQVAPLSGMKG